MRLTRTPCSRAGFLNPTDSKELATSIQAMGIIQPIVVRPSGDRYQLVAGERRWRAAKLAGLETIPVVIREIPDDRLLEITLVENIQREDLNPIETALAFERLAQELNLSHEQIGERTGKTAAPLPTYYACCSSRPTCRIWSPPADSPRVMPAACSEFPPSSSVK